jgi:hypothetical protein
MSLKQRGIIEDAGTASLLQQSVLELPHLLQACTCIFLQTVTAFLRAGQGVFNFTHNEMPYVIKAKFSTTGFNLIGTVEIRGLRPLIGLVSPGTEP